jgi:hypothetical protein
VVRVGETEEPGNGCAGEPCERRDAGDSRPAGCWLTRPLMPAGHNRERRSNSLQERAEPALNTFRQTIGSGQEPRDVVTESSPDVKVPAAAFVGRRHPHVPRSHEVAERVLHSLPDSDDHRRVGDVSNFNVNRVGDEHTPQRCKRGTVHLDR